MEVPKILIPRKRFGKDIHCVWTITTNGEAVSLEGRDLKVVISTPTNIKKFEPTFECKDNIVEFDFFGKDHYAHGVHNVTLWENYGQIGQTAVDKMNAFELVPNTDLEN